MSNNTGEDTFGHLDNPEERANGDADMLDTPTGLASTGGPSGFGITGRVIAGPDLAGYVDPEGDPLNADYQAGRETNVPGNETDTATGFAGEGGANPDSDLPPDER